jgi:hypothetical protein
MEFKLMVQPESGVEELVTHNSHLALIFTVVPVSEANFWTPLVMVICAETGSGSNAAPPNIIPAKNGNIARNFMARLIK